MRKFLVGIILILPFAVAAQSEIGPKIQVYPAGYITTLQFVFGSGETSAWTFETGYNTANRQDFGKHDNEEGGGFGFGAGFRRYFKKGMKGFYAEANLETWFLNIDWKNTSPAGVGSTDISVLQPTIGAGYQFRSQSEMWAVTLGITLGREWNVKTEGDPVGEGGISLLAFSVARRL